MTRAASPNRLHADRVPPVLQPTMRRVITTYRARGLRRDDLLLAAFPKCGSTYLRLVLASALTDQDVDYNVAARVFPTLGRQKIGPLLVPGGGRVVRSHEPPYFLGPRGRHPQVLWLARDGRDVLVSHYHHLVRQGRFAGDLTAFLPSFFAGKVGSFGSWHRHARAWLDYRARTEAVDVVRYEDLLADPHACLQRISDRFGLGIDDRIDEALRRNTPDEMRAKESSSQRLQSRSVRADISFVREARAGKWRENLTAEQCAAFERVAGTELRELGYPLAER